VAPTIFGDIQLNLLENDAWLILMFVKNDSYRLPDLSDELVVLFDQLVEVGYLTTTKPYMREQWTLTKQGEAALAELGPTETLFVQYSQNPSTLREADPNDEWDRGGDTDGGRFETVSRDRLYGLVKELSVPAKILEACPVMDLVWCTYATGDTFGSTSGIFDALGFCTTKTGEIFLEKYAAVRHDDYFGGLEDCHTETVSTAKE
jgi:predicted transcriptional regulator